MLLPGNSFQLSAIEEKLKELSEYAEANSPSQLKYNKYCAQAVDFLSKEVAKCGREDKYIPCPILAAGLANLGSFEMLKSFKSCLGKAVDLPSLQTFQGGSLENIGIFGTICFGTRFIMSPEWISPFLHFSLIREALIDKLKKCSTYSEILEIAKDWCSTEDLVELASQGLAEESEKMRLRLPESSRSAEGKIKLQIGLDNIDEHALPQPFTFCVETKNEDIEFAFVNLLQMRVFIEMFTGISLFSSLNGSERSERISRALNPSEIILKDLIGSSTDALIGINLEHHAREAFNDYRPGLFTKKLDFEVNQDEPNNDIHINPDPVIDRALKLAISNGIINPLEIDASKCRLGPSGQKVIVIDKKGNRIKAINASS